MFHGWFFPLALGRFLSAFLIANLSLTAVCALISILWPLGFDNGFVGSIKFLCFRLARFSERHSAHSWRDVDRGSSYHRHLERPSKGKFATTRALENGTRPVSDSRIGRWLQGIFWFSWNAGFRPTRRSVTTLLLMRHIESFPHRRATWIRWTPAHTGYVFLWR